MRTTYIPKNQVEEKKGVVDGKKIFFEVREIANDIKELISDEEESALEEQYSEVNHFSKYPPEEQNQNTKSEPPKPVKKKGKGIKIALGILAGCVLVGGAGVGYKYYTDNVNLNLQLVDLQSQVRNLYSSDKQVDIKEGISEDSLKDCYSEVSLLKEKDRDVSAIESELKTISSYIKDKNTLDSYLFEDFDLSTKGIDEDLESIKESISTYTVPGLALTLSDRITELKTSISDYANLKQELISITNVEEFDETAYQGKIDAVSHTINKKELDYLCKILSASRKALESEKLLEVASTEEEKAQAEQLLQDAKTAQEKATKGLSKVQKSMQKPIEEVKQQWSTTSDSLSSDEEGLKDILNQEKSIDNSIE